MLCARSNQYIYYQLSNGVRSLLLPAFRCSSSSCPSVATKQGKLAKTSDEEASTSPRINPLGVQMLSERLFTQIFGEPKQHEEKSRELQEKVERTMNHLKQHGLWDKQVELLPDVDFQIPKLMGNNLDEHFRAIASKQTKKYLQLLDKLIEKRLPRPPNIWNFQAGWTKYLPTGEMMTVDFPDDEELIFDVEVCVVEGRLPTLATAASSTSWYSWCSPRLTEKNFCGSQRITTDDLIPWETKFGEVNPPNNEWKERIVVGHNINYDRAIIKEQYYLKRPKTRFLDTMSMHIAVSGMSRSQRTIKFAEESNGNGKSENSPHAWAKVTSHNNLRDVHQLYCGGVSLNKEQRRIFVVSPMEDIKANFQQLMTYCCKDVVATQEVLQAILPLFLQRFPHPVTLAGMLEMNEFYLPVNENWKRFFVNAKTMYKKLEQEVKEKIDEIAKEAVKLADDNKHQGDPWLWDLNWRSRKSRRSSSTYNKFLPDKTRTTDLAENEMDAYPKWYRMFYGEEEPQPQTKPRQHKPTISHKLLLIPKLLRLSWDGHTLHFSNTHGWGYLVRKNPSKMKNSEDNITPSSVPIDTLWENMIKKLIRPNSDVIQNNIKEETALHTFFPLPQTNDLTYAENPLSGHFLTKIEDGTLKSEGDANAQRVLTIHKIMLNWRSMKKLVADELFVWLKETELTEAITRTTGYLKNKLYGVILPRIVAFGLPNRCATEQLWLTQGNANHRLGSEMLSMAQTPPGYKFVGADVDSQDLWISALLGDSNFAGLHGCTSLSWLLAQGRKSDGTDVHSYVADSMGISRDFAKVINYSRIYGLDESFARDLLRQFDRGLTLEEAKVKADELFAATRGIKGYRLNDTGIEMYKQWKNDVNLCKNEICLTKYEILEMLKNQSKLTFDDVISKSVWLGGTESALFNQLETIIQSEEPCTPFLGSRITRSLEPSVVNREFTTDRINWVVQSSSVDYLHLIVVCMRWLCELHQIDARFSFSNSDEVRYLVKTEDQYRAALALQISNLLARAMFSSKLGMNDLPQSAAFLSDVNIDTVLRREVTMDCKTPSNPDGLEKGYGIHPGESVDIFQILNKTNGTLESD